MLAVCSSSEFVTRRQKRLRALAWLCIRATAAQEVFLIAEFVRSRRLGALYEAVEVRSTLRVPAELMCAG